MGCGKSKEQAAAPDPKPVEPSPQSHHPTEHPDQTGLDDKQGAQGALSPTSQEVSKVSRHASRAASRAASLAGAGPDLDAGKPGLLDVGVSLAYLHRLCGMGGHQDHPGDPHGSKGTEGLVGGGKGEEGGPEGQAGGRGGGEGPAGRDGGQAHGMGDLTSDELVQQLVRPGTQGRRCRFVELLGPGDTTSNVLYYCWLQPGWGASMRQVVQLLDEHIQMMEPLLPPDQAGVWLSPFCLNHHNHPAHQAAQLSDAKRALISALPTLIVIDAAMVSSTRTAASGAASAAGPLSTVQGAIHQDDLQHATIVASSVAEDTGVLRGGVDQLSSGVQATAGSNALQGAAGAITLPQGPAASKTLQQGTAASGAGGTDGAQMGLGEDSYGDDDFSDTSSVIDQAVLGVTGGVTPCLVLLRSRQGLRGMQALQFNAPHVLHM